MREAAPALLPNPWLTVHPLYPGGFFPPARPVSAAGEGVLGQAVAARLAMKWSAARSAAEHAAASALEGGSADGEADALLELAATGIFSGAVGDAEARYRRILEGDPGSALRVRAMLGLAVVAGVRGDHGAALETLAEAEKAGGTLHDADLALLLANRCAVLTSLGRLGPAEHAGGEALRAGRRMKDEHLTAVGGFAVALPHLARGRRNEARGKLAEAARGFTRAGDVLRQVQCHHLLGEIAYDGEDPIRAGAHYRDGLALARPAGAVNTVELLTLRFEHR